MSPAAPQRFGFVQFEFAGDLGLAEGRFLVRADRPEGQPPDRGEASAAEDRHAAIESPTGAKSPAEESSPDPGGQKVLVVEVLGAPPRGRRRRGRRAGQEAELPGELAVTRVTIVHADREFDDEAGATAWLKQVRSDADSRALAADEAIAVLNRALHAQAVAGGDPYITERAPAQAAAVRIGHGLGTELAEGNFSAAQPLDLSPGKRPRRRTEGMGGQARVAAILGGREPVEACETLLLRVRADLDAGRDRAAAIGLRAGLEALLVELDGAMQDPGHTEDMGAIRAGMPRTAELAKAAARGPLGTDARANLAEQLAFGERVLRRRRILHG